MKYYTKEWFGLMQNMDYTCGMTPVADKTYSDREIRAFYEQDLAEEIERDRAIYRGEGAFDPAETAACFEECYRGRRKYAVFAYPEWFREEADRRLLALNRIPESAFKRLQREENENRRAWEKINAEAEAELTVQDIPPEIRAAFRFHDANVLRLKKNGKDVEMFLRDGGFIGGSTPYCRVIFRGVSRYEREKGLVIRTRRENGELGSNIVYLYDELYRTENGYEVHILLTGRNDMRYLTLACEKIEVRTGVCFDREEAADLLVSVLADSIGKLKPAPAVPDIRVYPEPIWLDYTEKDNSRWLMLMRNALKNAKTFEIHCWNEETDAIALALQYGNRKESDWLYGKIIAGKVTSAFVEMLLSQPKPADTEAANKMTPFFSVFLDSGFQSSHWGTEIYPGG